MNDYMTTPEDRRALWKCGIALAVIAAGVTWAGSARSEISQRETVSEAPAQYARHGRTTQRISRKRVRVGALKRYAPSRRVAGMVTVSTAANLQITVAPEAADKFQGFIKDVVALGYRPKQIHCRAYKGHVKNSNHYSGRACDFDQGGWNRTAGPMYRVGALARKWGLRDGCSFRDCGHIDIPPRWAGKPEPENIYAATARFKTARAVAQ